MSFPVFADGDVLNASDMNAVGLWLVKSQTIGSGVSSVSVTSCFNSNYDNYLVTVNGTAASNNGGTINFQVMSGSTASATGYYGNTFYVVAGAAGGLANANLTNASVGEMMSVSTSTANSGVLYIQAPYLAEYTRAQHQNSDNNYLRWHSIAHTIASSYDGIKLVPSAGTISGGVVRVYGMQK